MVHRELTEVYIAERDKLYRLSMIAGSNVLRDTIMAEHPQIVRTLLEKQKGK